VQPILYVCCPGDDYEETHRFPDNDPFFSEVLNLMDIKDIEEDPETAQILSTYEGMLCYLTFTNIFIETNRSLQNVCV
jgi:hypothetical protein